MMNVSKGVFTLFITIVLTACSSVQIEGSWVEPVPGMPEMVQGDTLENGGKATSINMATMQYEFWEKKGDKLVLSGKSIGNHQTISFSDTLQIEELTTENLVLKKGDLVINYQRQNKSQGGLV